MSCKWHKQKNRWKVTDISENVHEVKLTLKQLRLYHVKCFTRNCFVNSCLFLTKRRGRFLADSVQTSHNAHTRTALNTLSCH